jgi:hypothetical protein
MGFLSGSVSFRRFTIVGKRPTAISDEMLEKLNEQMLRPGEIGLPQEIEYGWSGGRHILDGTATHGENVFADTLVFALRVDVNKPSSDLKRAYTAIEEKAVAAENPSGFISKKQKQDVNQTVRARLEDEIRDGRHRRSKISPVLWHAPSGTVLSPVTGKKAEFLRELFERTFGLELRPASAGVRALEILEPVGKRRDYEDAKPTRFAVGPAGDAHWPEYPWTAKGDEAKDFLGNEFLLWLWYQAEYSGGTVSTAKAPSGLVGPKELTVYFDRSLDLECAYGITGKDGLRGDGVARTPEARDGIRSGKVPRKAGLVLDFASEQYALTLAAEPLGVSGAKLPELADAKEQREVIEHRIEKTMDLIAAIDRLFGQFLVHRTSGAWEGHVSEMKKWMLAPPRPGGIEVKMVRAQVEQFDTAAG